MTAHRLLFLAETATDAHAAIRRTGETGEDCTFVALRPEASYVFERNGVPFRSRNDFFDAEAANRICAENDRRIREISSRIDDAIHAATGDPLLKPATDCFVSLKILFDVVAVDALVLHWIVQQEDPARMHAFLKHPDPAGESHLPFTTGESVYAAILQESPWGVPVTFEPPPGCRPEQGTAPAGHRTLRRRIRDSLYRHPQLFDASCVMSRKGLVPAAGMLARRAASRDGATVLLYGSGYNWDDSLPELSAAGVRTIIRLEDGDVPAGAGPGSVPALIRDLCTHDPTIRSLAVIDGIDLSGVILPCVSRFVVSAWADARSAFDTAGRIIRDRGVSVLLLSSRDTPKGGHVVRAAREQHIPVISWQHGGAGYFDLPIQMYSELKGSDLHLVFGDGVKRTFEGTCRNHPQFPAPEITSAGSASLDAMAIPGKTPDGRPHVVYISTVYHNNMYYYPFRTAGGDFDESLWAFQRQVLGLAKRRPECDFTVKLYPSHESREPLRSWCADHACDNVRLVVREQTVADLLAAADVLVFDIVTTAILQALRTDRKIVAYTGIYRPEDDAVALLQRRAYASPDPGSCIAALEGYLDDRPLSGVDTSDDAFLRCYGTFQNDGKSATRAASLVGDRIRQARYGRKS
ncbi:MAG TPA: hypothetical protein VMT44_02665 [Methanoregula sp.]|nr:hypothetical protein [Methanoregula sp.]